MNSEAQANLAYFRLKLLDILVLTLGKILLLSSAIDMFRTIAWILGKVSQASDRWSGKASSQKERKRKYSKAVVAARHHWTQTRQRIGISANENVISNNLLTFCLLLFFPLYWHDGVARIFPRQQSFNKTICTVPKLFSWTPKNAGHQSWRTQHLTELMYQFLVVVLLAEVVHRAPQ